MHGYHPYFISGQLEMSLSEFDLISVAVTRVAAL